MPDRLIRTADGITGGILIILGALYIELGCSWLLWPTRSRLQGVEWVGVFLANETTVGIIWIVGGLITIACGAFSRRPHIESTGCAIGALVPFYIGLLFFGAWVGGARNDPAAAFSYWAYAVIAAYLGVRDILEKWGRTVRAWARRMTQHRGV